MSGALDQVPPTILEDLRERYSEPQRAYHTWQHIEELLALFDEVRPRLRNADAVLYAILFHDAVYDPRRGDNEERSADLLRAHGAGALDAQSLLAAARLIEATKAHRLPADLASGEAEDAALFLDMDIAILGAPSARFQEYDRQIRIEYAHVPDEVFQSARADILERFLLRTPLFLSKWGQERFESQARRNLRASLASPHD